MEGKQLIEHYAKKRIGKYLQDDLREAIKEGNGVRDTIFNFVICGMIGTIAQGFDKEVEELFPVGKLYQELLTKLDKKGVQLLDQYTDAIGSLEFIMQNNCLEKAIDLILEHIDIIVEEMNRAVVKEEK